MGRTAVCIDLHGLMGRGDLYDLRLAVSEDGTTLEVRGGSDAVAVVDTRTYEVAEPVEAPAVELPVAEPCRRCRRSRRLWRESRSRRRTRAVVSPGRSWVRRAARCLLSS